MAYQAGEFDVIVVGAGHAGIEASLAAARMGSKTVMLTWLDSCIATRRSVVLQKGSSSGKSMRSVVKWHARSMQRIFK